MKKNRFYRIKYLGSFLVFIICMETRASVSSLDSAEFYFLRGEYQKALNLWNDQIGSGTPSADLYYNIGITESRLGQTPNAIYSFEQALRLKPVNKVVQKALTAERKKIENAVIPVHPFFLQTWYKAFLSFLRPGYWAMLGLVLLGLFTLNWLAGFQILFQKPVLKDKLKWITAGLAILSLFMAAIAYREIYREDEAIVYTTCRIRQAPSEESPEIRTLYPGEKVFLRDRIGSWLNVKLLNQDAGWVNNDCLKKIHIGPGSKNIKQ